MTAFACNTYSYMRSHTAQACLRHLADLGFRDFELMMHPGHAWPPELDAAARRDLRRSIESRGLRLVSLNMPNIDLNVAGASPEMRDYTLRILDGIVALAGELGAPGIVMVPGKHNPLFADDPANLAARFYAALDRLLPLAQRAGTALWIENVPFAFEGTTQGLMDLLARYGDDSLGITFDVANAHFIGEEIGEALACCAPRLKLVHLSDTSREVYRHDPVGDGTVPFGDVPAALARIGHRQAPVLEVISRDPDRDILTSRDRLVALGFPAQISTN
jgi:sugar phosphate isomerase/epimerase